MVEKKKLKIQNEKYRGDRYRYTSTQCLIINSGKSNFFFFCNSYIKISFIFSMHLKFHWYLSYSINILEIGARAEGLEEAEEDLFGPDGYISNSNGHVFRKKRFQSRYSKLNRLKEMYMKRKNGAGKSLQLSYYIRVIFNQGY